MWEARSQGSVEEDKPVRIKTIPDRGSNELPNERAGGRDKDATRQRILDAAEEVFADKGYHGTVVDDIIRGAKTSKGGFYFYFPSKQGIFLALIDALAPKLMAAVDRAIDREETAPAKVDAALRTVLDQFSRHRRLSK